MKDIEQCVRCGYPKVEHFTLNHADGAYVSANVLICPTAVYRPLHPKAEPRENR